jgi:hypothetical protein
MRFHNIPRDCQTKPKTIVATDPNWSPLKTIKEAGQTSLATNRGDLPPFTHTSSAAILSTLTFAGHEAMEQLYEKP